MKSFLTLARAAAGLVLGGQQQERHGRLLSTSTSGIASSRVLMDHQTLFMQTLQTTAMEAMELCDINLQSLSLFGDVNIEEDTTDTGITDPTTPTVDLLEILQNYASLFGETCSEADEKTFRTALEAFQTCSSFDLEGVLEAFSDAIVGSVLECAMDAAPLLDTISGLDDLADFPVKCANALLGKNPLGDIIRSTILYPDKILSCFPALTTSIPTCTVDEWPVPLVGPILKKAACFLGQGKIFASRTSEHNLGLLDVCLPELDDIVNEEELPQTCDSYCSHLVGTEVMLNVPFSDISKAMAEGKGLSDVIPRFEAFAAQCLADPWQGWSYAVNDYDAVNVKLFPKHDPSAASGAGSPSSDGGNDDAENGNNNYIVEGESSAPAMVTNIYTSEEDRFGKGFLTGFLTGLFAAGIMWAVVQYCSHKMRKQERGGSNTNSKEPDDNGSTSGDSESSDPDIYQDITHTIT